MRNFIPSLFLIILTFSVTSCSKDNDDNIVDRSSSFVGVWEQEGFMETSGHRLVFASDYSGLKIYRKTEEEGVISAVKSYSWYAVDSVVTIYEEDNEIVGVYSLNPEGQLVSEDLDELPYDKISDTTLNY